MNQILPKLAALILAVAIAAGSAVTAVAERSAPVYRRAAELKIPTFDRYTLGPPIINNIAISPDGRWLAATGSATYLDVYVFDMATRTIARILKRGTSGDGGLAFLRDSRHLLTNSAVSASSENKVAAGVWDIETGEEVARLLLPEMRESRGMAKNFAVSRDGKHVAISAGSADFKSSHIQVAVYETQGWTRVASTLGISDEDWKSRFAHGKPPGETKFGFALNGDRLVIGGYDGAFRVWNFVTGRIERVVGAFNLAGYIGELDVSLDGKFAAVVINVTTIDEVLKSITPLLKVFDITTGKLVAAIPIYKGVISTAKFTPDGEYILVTGAVAKGQRYTKVYRVADQLMVAEFEPAQFIVRSSAFSEDGKYFAVGGEQNILIYERVEQ